MTYALDTNTVIHLLQNSPLVIAWRDSTLKHGDKLIMPPYVHFEIQRGFHYVSAPAKERAYRLLRSHCTVGEMTIEVWEAAASLHANLRRKHLTVGDANTLIAAFCTVNNYTLVTANTKDFENMEGLHVTNWTK